MLDRITAFFQQAGRAIGRGIGLLVAWLLWPFMAAGGWYGKRHWMVKGPILAVLAVLIGLYGYFFIQTQIWSGFNPNFVDTYRWSERTVPAGQELPPSTAPAGSDATPATTAANPAARQCQSSAIVDAAADLTDFNVNQNAWISSMLL